MWTRILPIAAMVSLLVVGHKLKCSKNNCDMNHHHFTSKTHITAKVNDINVASIIDTYCGQALMQY